MKLEKQFYYQSYYSGRKECNMTAERSTKIRNPAILLTSVFFIVAGVAEIGYYLVENVAAPPHIPVLGVFSLIAAFTLYTMNRWAVPLVVGLLLTGTTFAATTLVNSVAVQTFEGALLFHLTLVAYMILLLLASLYVLAKRASFS